MPSTATITAFYNFSANTKARASHVNANFDTLRGHLLPISPTTATAIDNTYDLGSTEYRYSNAYLGSKLQFGNTTTNSVVFEKDINTSTGELIIKSNNVEVSRIIPEGGLFCNETYGQTTSATLGKYAYSTQTSFSTLNLSVANTLYTIGGSLTIKSSGRLILLYCLQNTGQSYWGGSRTTSTSATIDLCLTRVSSLSSTANKISDSKRYETSAILRAINTPIFIDQPGIGTFSYSVAAVAYDTACSISFPTHRLIAKEIF